MGNFNLTYYSQTLPATEIVPSKVSAKLDAFLYLKMEAELAFKM
jgi:hypothetical protein